MPRPGRLARLAPFAVRRAMGQAVARPSDVRRARPGPVAPGIDATMERILQEQQAKAYPARRLR